MKEMLSQPAGATMEMLAIKHGEYQRTSHWKLPVDTKLLGHEEEEEGPVVSGRKYVQVSVEYPGVRACVCMRQRTYESLSESGGRRNRSVRSS